MYNPACVIPNFQFHSSNRFKIEERSLVYGSQRIWTPDSHRVRLAPLIMNVKERVENIDPRLDYVQTISWDLSTIIEQLSISQDLFNIPNRTISYWGHLWDAMSCSSF